MIRASTWRAAVRSLQFVGVSLLALILPDMRLANAQAAGPGSSSDRLVARWKGDLEGADGYLFVNGDYVSLPCEIAIEGESLIINDVALTSKTIPIDEADWGHGRMRRSTPGGESRRLGNEVVQGLIGGNLVVAMPGQPVVSIGRGKAQYDLLKVLLADTSRVMPVSVQRQLLPDQQPGWNAWLSAFEPTEAFRQRAEASIAQYDSLEAEATRAIAATRRL